MAIHSFPAWKTGTRGRPHTASHALSVERAILICGAICSSNWRSQSRLVTSCKDDRRENGASKAQQQVYLHMSAHLGKNCKRTRGRMKNGVCTKTTTDAGWPSFRCVCRLAKTATITRRGHTNPEPKTLVWPLRVMVVDFALIPMCLSWKGEWKEVQQVKPQTSQS